MSEPLSTALSPVQLTRPDRRTYGEGIQGEIIKDGFDPRQLRPQGDESAIDDEDEDAQMSEGRGKNSMKYEDLDDQHVWNSKDGN